MERHKDVHYEIQCENPRGEWAELLERPKSEEEIPELCYRARAWYPGEKIRVVKVTTTVVVEKVAEDPGTGSRAFTVDRELHLEDQVHELLQDCD
jgi:hypothetical protein